MVKSFIIIFGGFVFFLTNHSSGKNQIQKALEETGAIRIIQQSIESMEKSRHVTAYSRRFFKPLHQN